MSEDEREIREVIARMYAMISGPAGPRDWSRQSEIFHPACHQMRTGQDGTGQPWIAIFTPEEFRANADAMLAEMDFYEVELVSTVEVFGNMAQAWSSYEAKHDPADDVAERRGINAIQFYKDESGRWRIISMIWDNERDGLTLPSGMTRV